MVKIVTKPVGHLSGCECDGCWRSDESIRAIYGAVERDARVVALKTIQGKELDRLRDEILKEFFYESSS